MPKEKGKEKAEKENVLDADNTLRSVILQVAEMADAAAALDEFVGKLGDASLGDDFTRDEQRDVKKASSYIKAGLKGIETEMDKAFDLLKKLARHRGIKIIK
jgi:hypothetical protein